MDTPSNHPDSAETDLLQAGFRFALALTHHREEAEDLVQETWLNLCRRYGGVENQAVLFTSLRNLFIDQCRHKKLIHFESIDHAELPELFDVPTEEPCVKGELAALLGLLKPSEREVIFLHYYQGHTAEEISAITGQSRGTVLSLIHRSIAKLRKASQTDREQFPSNQALVLFVLLMASFRLKH